MRQRFIWVYLLSFMNAIWSRAIQGKLLSNIRWKDLLDALRGLMVESIERWSKKHLDKTWKQTSDHKTKLNQKRRSKQSLHESQGEPQGERDIIRLQNPTEDKRTFRLMLTSAHLGRHGWTSQWFLMTANWESQWFQGLSYLYGNSFRLIPWFNLPNML